MRTVVFSHTAAKELDSLPTDVGQAITDALDALAIESRGDVKKLAGEASTFRLRVGRYRVLFEQSASAITVLYVGKRETTTYR